MNTSREDPVGPEATPNVSVGPGVGVKLSLLTDSVGLVCWADDKVVLLSVREVSETMVFQANVELRTADDGRIRALDTRVLQISGNRGKAYIILSGQSWASASRLRDPGSSLRENQ